MVPSLNENVAAAVASGRIGVPVAVRLFCRRPPASESASEWVARLAGLAGGWLEDEPVRVHAVENGDAVTLTISYATGKTAMLSVAIGDAPGASLILLGNTGAVYHDSLSPGVLLAEPADLPPGDPVIRAALEESLRTGRAVECRGRGG